MSRTERKLWRWVWAARFIRETARLLQVAVLLRRSGGQENWLMSWNTPSLYDTDYRESVVTAPSNLVPDYSETGWSIRNSIPMLSYNAWPSRLVMRGTKWDNFETRLLCRPSVALLFRLICPRLKYYIHADPICAARSFVVWVWSRIDVVQRMLQCVRWYAMSVYVARSTKQTCFPSSRNRQVFGSSSIRVKRFWTCDRTRREE